MAVDGVGAGGAGAAPAAAAGGGADVAGQTAQMQQLFAQATQENAAITKVQTEGNTAKRAASAAPQ